MQPIKNIYSQHATNYYPVEHTCINHIISFRLSDTILLHISAQCQQLIHKKQEKRQSFFLMRMSLNKQHRRAPSPQTPCFIGSIGFFEKLYAESTEYQRLGVPSSSSNVIIQLPWSRYCSTVGKSFAISVGVHLVITFTSLFAKATTCFGLSSSIILSQLPKPQTAFHHGTSK